MQKHPLQWPAGKPRTPADQREIARFHKQVYNGNWNEKKRLTIADAVSRIEDAFELYTRFGRPDRIPPETVIISTNLIVGKMGRPLSSQPEPQDPGVAVYFILDGRPFCYECDKWTRVADNLAAVAAHAQSIRDIERWGVGLRHDVYEGFKALPVKAGPSTGGWWIMLEVQETASPDIIKSAYRRLAARYHPDNGVTGNIDKFNQVQQAWERAKISKNIK